MHKITLLCDASSSDTPYLSSMIVNLLRVKYHFCPLQYLLASCWHCHHHHCVSLIIDIIKILWSCTLALCVELVDPCLNRAFHYHSIDTTLNLTKAQLPLRLPNLSRTLMRCYQYSTVNRTKGLNTWLHLHHLENKATKKSYKLIAICKVCRHQLHKVVFYLHAHPISISVMKSKDA